MVVHDGRARAARIPLTHNAPGFDQGVSGPDLLDRMTRHAEKYGAVVREMRVENITRDGSTFVLSDASSATVHARAVILATGLELNQIPLDDETHETAIKHAVLRYCPVCDGFEHKGARIAVVGCDVSGAAEALFLRTFSDDVTLLPQRDVELTVRERADLEAAGVKTMTAPVERYDPSEIEMAVTVRGATDPLHFDVVYPALGCRPRNDLAVKLGVEIDAAGKVAANAPFETAVPGLYCAGDLVDGLDQISVAMGHGAVAATKAHNWLRDYDGETAEAVLE